MWYISMDSRNSTNAYGWIDITPIQSEDISVFQDFVGLGKERPVEVDPKIRNLDSSRPRDIDAQEL